MEVLVRSAVDSIVLDFVAVNTDFDLLTVGGVVRSITVSLLKGRDLEDLKFSLTNVLDFVAQLYFVGNLIRFVGLIVDKILLAVLERLGLFISLSLINFG